MKDLKKDLLIIIGDKDYDGIHLDIISKNNIKFDLDIYYSLYIDLYDLNIRPYDHKYICIMDIRPSDLCTAFNDIGYNVIFEGE